MAADFSGRRITLGVGKETTRGTVANAAYWLQHLTVDFQATADKVLNTSGLGVLDKNNAAEIVKQWAEGKVEGKITDKAFGLLLLALFGTDTPALHSGETLVYDHAFSETNTNQNQSLTFVRKDPNEDYQYALCMIKQLQLSVAVGDFVKYTLDLVSKIGTSGSDTAAYVTENEFKAKHAIVKLAANVAALTGATAIPVKAFNITVDKNVSPYFVVGSNDPSDIFNTTIDVKGDFTLRYSDTTYRSLFFNNTYQALQLDIKNTDVTIGTAANPELILVMPKVILESWKLDQKMDDMVEQTIGFQALFDQTTGKQISATFTNTVASY